MQWLKNLNAMPKLMISFGLMLVVTAGIGYFGVQRVADLNGRIGLQYERDIAGLEALKQVEVDAALIARYSEIFVLHIVDPTTVVGDSRKFEALFVDLRTSLGSARAKAQLPNLQNQIAEAASLLPEYEDRLQRVLENSRNGDANGARTALRESSLSTDQLNRAVGRALEINKFNIETFQLEAGKALVAARANMIALVVAAIFLGFGLSLVIARSFSKPLGLAVDVLGHLAAGDLTRTLEISGENEIGKLAGALNQAILNIRNVLSQVRESSINLTSASSQLAQAADALAGGAQEQAASLEETSSSLEEITATVKRNSENARQASQFAASSRDTAEKGGGVVTAAVGAMTEINTSSARIAAIIGTIDEIAFQTNLLAVNASVEAARAGEHGRGFAVVATEVRNLAQRSASAAKEIKSLIGDTVRKVENGSQLVNRSGQTLNEIVTSVKRVTDIVSEIAAASHEQSLGIEQVNGAMLQMDRVLQSNSSQTEELSATANTLASQAAHLEQLVGSFVVKSAAHRSGIEVALARAGEGQTAPANFVRPAEKRDFDTSLASPSGSLTKLAKSVGRPIPSVTALDEEFEEF